MKLAVVRVRGLVRVRHDIKRTLELLGLKTSNSCAVIEDNPRNRKVLEKIKDYVTWGSATEDTIKICEAKRLNPPRKGFGRKGVKLPFKLGGALGERGEKINDLILRMKK